MSWNSTDPSKLFGGTWVRIKGGFVYGCKDQSSVGNGSGTDTNSHALTVDQIPSHSHGTTNNGVVWVRWTSEEI